MLLLEDLGSDESPSLSCLFFVQAGAKSVEEATPYFGSFIGRITGCGEDAVVRHLGQKLGISSSLLSLSVLHLRYCLTLKRGYTLQSGYLLSLTSLYDCLFGSYIPRLSWAQWLRFRSLLHLRGIGQYQRNFIDRVNAIDQDSRRRREIRTMLRLSLT